VLPKTSVAIGGDSNADALANTVLSRVESISPRAQLLTIIVFIAYFLKSLYKLLIYTII